MVRFALARKETVIMASFLIPPGNPTVEPEMIEMAPQERERLW
jgi:hypothetical protein